MINKHILKLSYPEYGGAKDKNIKLDLSTSENPVKLKFKSNIDFSGYSFSQDPELIEKISFQCRANPKNILLTAGCDGALHHIAETLIDTCDEVLIPCPSFGRYEYHTKVLKGKPLFLHFDKFPFEFRIDKIIMEIQRKRPKLVFIANPNNPTGHYLEKEKIIQLLENAKETYIVLDEALIDYLGEENSCADLIEQYPNLIVTRSFSKLYGMAGLRLGYMLANENLITEIAKTVSPFEVNNYAIDIAKQALGDIEHKKMSREIVKSGLDVLRQSGIKITDTQTAIALICEENIYEYLKDHGIMTVSGENFRGLDKNCARVCIKDTEIMKKVIKVLNQKLKIQSLCFP